MEKRVRNGDSGNVKNEDVRTAINMSSETFSTYRKRLIDRGIVDGRQFGYLRLRLPRLENYVKLR